MPRFSTRRDAVFYLAVDSGAFLRRTIEKIPINDLREILGKSIDLAWLPNELADKYENSNKAWNRFLNDILKEAGIRI